MNKQPFPYRGFLPYALAAFLIGAVGGFSAVLGPAFVSDLQIPYSNTTWTALAQAMATAAWAPILGRLADTLGRKTTMRLGLAIFTAGNLLTALANSLHVMLAARFLVGLGTAAMAPVILAYIVTAFPPATVSRGFSAYMLISGSSVVFGPTLGSLLIAQAGWRAMAWLCTGICGVIAPLCLLLLKETSTVSPSGGDFDTGGAVFTVIFFSLLLCLPSFGQNLGWQSAPFRIAILGTVLALPGLILTEKKAAVPVLSLSLMQKRPFYLSILALFLTQGLMQANMTNTIVFVNYTQPTAHLVSGLSISVLYLGMSLGAVILGPLADRFPAKNVLTGSLLLTGIGCGLMLLFSARTPLSLLMLSLGALGFGLGGNGTVFMKVALDGTSTGQAAAGAGTYGLFRDLAAPFGVAVLVPLFTNGIATKITTGVSADAAAVASVHTLAVVELLCIACGILIVRLLPKSTTGG